jgi:hypothetical protein
MIFGAFKMGINAVFVRFIFGVLSAHPVKMLWEIQEILHSLFNTWVIYYVCVAS